MDIIWILDLDPHNNRCGSATLQKGLKTVNTSESYQVIQIFKKLSTQIIINNYSGIFTIAVRYLDATLLCTQVNEHFIILCNYKIKPLLLEDNAVLVLQDK